MTGGGERLDKADGTRGAEVNKKREKRRLGLGDGELRGGYRIGTKNEKSEDKLKRGTVLMITAMCETLEMVRQK